ncbi:Hypothetical predicted protein [Cloeon dipterum]|uniref:LIM zinc-binding domain-containing protein n=1 Tax=Cloeon dipterum TaxID=197152 RepID=A0A8S1C7X3_9INSE|nr:Hypothetical predicted protein [Cloeon dipterum]
MNPHFHGYSELSSPHSPPPDNSSYHQQGPQGPHQHPPPGMGGPPVSNGGGPPHGGMHHHHEGGMHPHGGPHSLHHAHPGPYPPPQHILNNNNNNINANNNVNNNIGPGGMGGMGSPTSHMHPGQGGGGGPQIKVCAGCGGKIVERYLLYSLDRYWHNGCLKCQCCHAMLADIGTSCYTKGGMILCKNDYARMFGNSAPCTACGQNIPASEFVTRIQGQVYHQKCFSCSKCGCQLLPGDRFCLMAGSPVCEQDWHKFIKSASVTGQGPLTPGTPGGPNTGGPQTGPVRKGKVGRPRRSRD